ncbi:hypothetical protein, partial [Streptomyces resistomycificus]|uniref:hypothetical protein n=1 Tax=Streptomyces resistomycificus TaxID=67356 RepID=UPI0005683C2F
MQQYGRRALLGADALADHLQGLAFRLREPQCLHPALGQLAQDARQQVDGGDLFGRVARQGIGGPGAFGGGL